MAMKSTFCLGVAAARAAMVEKMKPRRVIITPRLLACPWPFFQRGDFIPLAGFQPAFKHGTDPSNTQRAVIRARRPIGNRPGKDEYILGPRRTSSSRKNRMGCKRMSE